MNCTFSHCPFYHDYTGYYFLIYTSIRTDFHIIQVTEGKVSFEGSELPDMPIYCGYCEDEPINCKFIIDYEMVVIFYGDDFLILKKTKHDEKNN
jgi:hypothetical protein